MLDSVDYFVLLLGFASIWFLYKKLTQDHRAKIERWSDKEDLKAEVVKNSNYIQTYKKMARTFSYLWLFTILNSNITWFENWALIVLFGCTVAWYVFMFGGAESQFWTMKLQESPKSYEFLREHSERRHNNTKNVLVTLLITSLIAGSWAYQDEKRYREDQESAIARVLELPGQGWCGTFEDIDWNGETAVKRGGWPCIYIANVESVEFLKEDGKVELCTYLSFDVESGLPGANSFSLDTDYQEFCLSKDEFGGWGTYALEEKIELYVKPELNDLVKSLCGVFRYQLTEPQQSTYCST